MTPEPAASPKSQFADSLNTHTLQVKQRLEELQRQEGTSDVVVVGGGYAGIELASVAAEMLAGNSKFFLHISCAASCALQQGTRGCAGCCCKSNESHVPDASQASQILAISL